LVWSLAGTLRQPGISEITLVADGTLALSNWSNASGCCRVEPQTTVLPGLVILFVRDEQRRAVYVLPVESLGSEGHRQLRLWLKWRAAGPVSVAGA
jgi:hypothetical protein